MFTPADGLPTRALSAVFERRDGTYWVAGGEQLCLFDPRPDRTRFQCESPKLGAIRSLLEDEQGLWCGSDSGLWRRAAGGGQSLGIRSRPRTGTDWALDQIGKLLKDTRGDVWASTFFGLYRFRLNGRVERWTHAQGLEMDQGTALAETPGSIWAGSQRELIRFQIDPSSGAAAIANRYSRSHGLPSGYVERCPVLARTSVGSHVSRARTPVTFGRMADSATGSQRARVSPGAVLPRIHWAIFGSALTAAVRYGFRARDYRASQSAMVLVFENVWAVFEDRQRNLMAVTKDEDHYFLNRFDGYRFHPRPAERSIQDRLSAGAGHTSLCTPGPGIGGWQPAPGFSGTARARAAPNVQAPSRPRHRATSFASSKTLGGAIWVSIRDAFRQWPVSSRSWSRAC